MVRANAERKVIELLEAADVVRQPADRDRAGGQMRQVRMRSAAA